MTNLKFNVAQLLREEMGSFRDYQFAESQLPLDDQLTLREINGTVRFTRTATGVWAKVKAIGVVRLICVRSLEEFDQPISLAFADQFHSVIDIFSGGGLPAPIEEDPFMLDELHMADIGETLREYGLLELPLNPVSPAYRDQPVNYTVQSEGIEDEAELASSEDGTVDIEALKVWAERHQRRNGRS